MSKLVAVHAALKPEARDIARRYIDRNSARVRTLANRLLDRETK